ncbi:glutamate receptor [Striga asiatica]|uniref:Glutamate receptor n=1 Tax=Striga asiatica TaxID=4170 RepID=A0A5A7R3S5_STRAF|nr:glutamate receptor [Striga asiatica]
MVAIIEGSGFFVPYILILLVLFSNHHLINCHEEKVSEQITVIDIGVVRNPKSPFGEMINLCLEMAISDFYTANPDYKTRLRLRTKEAEDTLGISLAALHLVQQEQVHAILWHHEPEQAETFVVELGRKSRVPIISFTSTTEADFPTPQNPYLVRASLDDSVQARALTSVFREFAWKNAVILYEDSVAGRRFLSRLNAALRDIEIALSDAVAVPPSTDGAHILSDELAALNENQTVKVFLVHAGPALGSRLFAAADEVGMMRDEHAWIVAGAMSDSMMSSVAIRDAHRESMEGAVGVRARVPSSDELEKFRERWRIKSTIMKIEKEKEDGYSWRIMDLNVRGLLAYDTVTALATAVEKIVRSNASSAFGPQLREEMFSIRVEGLSGEFEISNGTLKPSALEIFNVVGSGERRLGFWTPENGIVRDLDPKPVKELKRIVWPGDSAMKPKGWVVPPTGPVRIGVPWKPGYTEFLKVKIDDETKQVEATGFVIDIFLATLKVLPFPINYTFVCYNGTGDPDWKYDDMLAGIPEKKFDMVVGDTTILSSRASYVDYSLPYAESGLVHLVKNEKPFDMWIFTKPLRWDLWLAITLSCVIMGSVICVLERGITNPAPVERPITKFDMVVGDTTILSSRASYVDYSLPYAESGLVHLFKNEKPFDTWIFTKTLRQTCRIEGLGFAFPVGSPLAPYFSRAILNVTQGPEMTRISGRANSSQDPLSSTLSQRTSSLSFYDFAANAWSESAAVFAAMVDFPTPQNPYLMRAFLDDSGQARALASVFREFAWKNVVILYKDSAVGRRFLSRLSAAFRDARIALSDTVAAPPSAGGAHMLSDELAALNKNQMVKVFLVHVGPALGSRSFAAADEMKGAVGVRARISPSYKLKKFRERWRIKSTIMKIEKEKEDGYSWRIMDLNVRELWAYDTVTALAIAVEKIPSTLEIFNVVGSGERRIGVSWKPGYTGFLKVKIDDKTKQVEATGFVIDIFLATLKMLSFPNNYTFVCYNASYVDYSLPYAESGLVHLVKNEKPFDTWIFTKPLRWDLWRRGHRDRRDSVSETSHKLIRLEVQGLQSDLQNRRPRLRISGGVAAGTVFLASYTKRDARSGDDIHRAEEFWAVLIRHKTHCRPPCHRGRPACLSTTLQTRTPHPLPPFFPFYPKPVNPKFRLSRALLPGGGATSASLAILRMSPVRGC